MKLIDKTTERRLYWLFTPMALVMVWFILYIWFDIDVLKLLSGVDVDVLSAIYPAIISSYLFIMIGYSIAAIKQKCWGLFAAILAITIVMFLNMSNFFVDLFIPGE